MNIKWVPNKVYNKDRVEDLLSKSLESNQFTNGGPVVKLLEETIRTRLKISDDKDIIPVCNGTVAIWVAISSIELKRTFSLKREHPLKWATQSFTFPPSAQGNLQDVLITDIDEEGGMKLYEGLEKQVDGIIVTNVFGNLVNIDKYVDWCNKYNKYLVFDNAATSFSFYKGINSLNYGNCCTISFHHTKPIGFGEGGAVIIDKQYSQILRNLINFGIDNNSIQPKWHPYGSNYKMSDISAAYIIQHLEKLDSILEKTIDVTEHFKESIKDIKTIKMYPNFSDTTPLFSCLAILFDKEDDSLVCQHNLIESGVYCRKYYNPLLETTNAINIYNKILCIPIHPDINKEDINKIVNICKMSF